MDTKYEAICEVCRTPLWRVTVHGGTTIDFQHFSTVVVGGADNVYDAIDLAQLWFNFSPRRRVTAVELLAEEYVKGMTTERPPPTRGGNV